jgi:hypothetical protein
LIACARRLGPLHGWVLVGVLVGCSDLPPMAASPPPPLQLGLDAYRNWQRMYRPKIGVRTYMRSTYDRSGGNEWADASHFLRQERDDFHVTLDVAGPGVVSFVRTNHWHGSPWHYVVDGVDHVVTESSTADPRMPVENSVFMPEAAFPSPLTFTWSATRGADLSWVPIAFDTSFTLAYGRTFYGTGYYIYQLLPAGSAELPAFSAEAPDPEVLALLGRAGEDIAPSGERASGSSDVAPGAQADLAHLQGRRTIVSLKLHVAREQAAALAQARLRITWDGQSEPSVDAPVGYFFGSGSLYARDAQEWLVRGLLTNIRFDAERIHLASYFPMPFERSAKVSIQAGAAPLKGVEFELRSQPSDDPPAWTSHFHATFRDHGEPVPGRDLVLLDTTQTEGGGDFCGSFVGTSFSFSDRALLTTLEGDPRFFFDDSLSPQAYGTGTEEWAGGGDYWGGRNMTLPLAGHPGGAPDAASAQNADDQVETAYRVLIADAMPFGKNARIQLEHGGLNDSTEHYRTVTYWYGRRGACLVRTDSLDIGDEADERAHRYASATASAVQTLSSRYELGLSEVQPETTEDGRSMSDTSEFSVQLRPDNLGALLRRRLDYGFPDQRAVVSVADDRPGAEFQSAGTWYLAGSNRCVYSNPPGELDPPAPIVQVSDRRLREDEFLIPRALTVGRRAIRLRVKFEPIDRPILLGDAVPPLAWSELRYDVYAWVLPN